MPAIYAHRAFGEDVKKRLARDRYAEVFAFPDSFALGLHGPDTLFYFHPLGHNAVNRRGNAMHEESAALFFTRSRDIFVQRGCRAAERAYLYGFVCHFALDSVCHPEVAAQMRKYDVSHTAVEAAFERCMLERDGLDPVRAHVESHIRASGENVCAVAAYCGVSEKQARRAICSMVRCSRLLRAPNACKRALLHFALRLAGSKSVIDMIVPAQDKPVHAKGNAALAACYARALEKAVSLIGNLRGFLAGEEALDEAFSSNYESEEKI